MSGGVASILEKEEKGKNNQLPFNECLQCDKNCAKCFTYIASFDSTIILWGGYYYPDFTDEKSEA